MKKFLLAGVLALGLLATSQREAAAFFNLSVGGSGYASISWGGWGCNRCGGGFQTEPWPAQFGAPGGMGGCGYGDFSGYGGAAYGQPYSYAGGNANGYALPASPAAPATVTAPAAAPKTQPAGVQAAVYTYPSYQPASYYPQAQGYPGYGYYAAPNYGYNYGYGYGGYAAPSYWYGR